MGLGVNHRLTQVIDKQVEPWHARKLIMAGHAFNPTMIIPTGDGQQEGAPKKQVNDCKMNFRHAPSCCLSPAKTIIVRLNA